MDETFYKPETSKDEIVQLAMNDPVIYAVLQAYRKGYFVDWEQAMMTCVKIYHDQNARLQENLRKLYTGG